MIEFVLNNINGNEINGICMSDLAKWHDWSQITFKKIKQIWPSLMALNYKLSQWTKLGSTRNSKISNTKLIEKGVSQGSILGSLFFTIFNNDFPLCLSNAFCNTFANDTMRGASDKSLTKIQLLTLNIDKWVYVLYSTPTKLKSGSACHMTRSANHHRHSVVIFW